MKAILFLAAFVFGGAAFASPVLDSQVSVAPNAFYPSSVVNVTIRGSAAEEIFSAIEVPANGPAFNADGEVRLFGSTVCTRKVIADEVRQASVVSFECVINVFTKSR